MGANVAGGECPLVVRRPVMTQRWELLTFLHWSFQPDVIQQLLPAGLTVETFDRRGWVGLVPFHMRVAPPRLTAPYWLGRFCETNVRTYVTDSHGRSGVWFLSLDAARLAAVVVARLTYRLPYFWAGMSLTGTPDRFVYTSQRRWPTKPAAAGGRIIVRPGAAVLADDVTELEHFLTARWRVFSHVGRAGLRYAEAEHSPWPLKRAEVELCEDSLVTAAGLPRPVGAPLAHFSDGVDVRIGLPRRVT
jgi:uncharacterized protein YqjF (DUF2071 family)